MPGTVSLPSSFTNRGLLLPFLLPYLTYVALGGLPLSREAVYGLRLLALPFVLAWAWRWYPSVTGPRHPAGSVGVGLLAGLAGAALWGALRLPFLGEQAAPAWTGPAFSLRMAAAGVLAPVVEEFLMRGYVLRVALQWGRARRQGEKDPFGLALDGRSLLEIEPGAWSPWAVTASTLAFAAGHRLAEWPAALAYGALMAALWIVRRDLLSCIVAHGVTNLALGGYARATGQWGLW